MHQRVKLIFDEHDRWLKGGGDQAIEGVRQANLAAVIDKHLAEYAEEVRWGYRNNLRAAIHPDDKETFERCLKSLGKTYSTSQTAAGEMTPAAGSAAPSPADDADR